MGGAYDEIDLEDMDWNAELGAFTFQCPTSSPASTNKGGVVLHALAAYSRRPGLPSRRSTLRSTLGCSCRYSSTCVILILVLVIEVVPKTCTALVAGVQICV